MNWTKLNHWHHPSGTLLAVCVASLSFSTPQSFGAPPAPQAAAKFDLAQLASGPIVITSPLEPASFSFAAANARVQSAGEGAANSTSDFLRTPNLAHPQLEAVVGAVQFTLAPFAAAYGAISAGHQRLPPDKLRESERDLTDSLSSAACQRNLAELVFENAREKTHRALSCQPETQVEKSSRKFLSAILETKIERLQLESAGKSNNRYALHVAARARLLRASDGSVLLDRPYHYRSGCAMFIDWTRQGGLESVAQTAYRDIARQITRDVFQPVSEPPLLLGVGQKSQPVFTSIPLRPFANHWSGEPSLQRVSYLQKEVELFRVLPGYSDQQLYIPGLAGDRNDSANVQSDTEWALDGLEENRNAVVQVVSCFAAVPMGIWEQTIGAARNASRAKAEQAAGSLNGIVRQTHSEQALTDQVTKFLRSQTVELVTTPMQLLPFVSPGLETLNGMLPEPMTRPNLALEIQVTSTELVGKHDFSRSRALSVEILATVYRTVDGQEVYSLPVHYRSPDRKLAEWAANNGELFRTELGACNRQTAQAIAAKLLSRGLVSPARSSDTIAANH